MLVQTLDHLFSCTVDAVIVLFIKSLVKLLDEELRGKRRVIVSRQLALFLDWLVSWCLLSASQAILDLLGLFGEERQSAFRYHQQVIMESREPDLCVRVVQFLQSSLEFVNSVNPAPTAFILVFKEVIYQVEGICPCFFTKIFLKVFI